MTSAAASRSQARRGFVSRRALVLLAGAALATSAVGLWLKHRHAEQQRARGEALFVGSAALPGRLAGHATALPTQATRCINCHSSDATATPAAPTLGPPLTGQRLASMQSRRGGPATRFDAASLCRALRSGVDPAQILLPTSMPRYDATEAQCADLWAHLVSS